MPSKEFFLHAPLDELRILRKPDVLRIVGLSEARVRVLERQGDFPKRIALSANSVGYSEHEVRAWLASRVARTVQPLGARALGAPALPPSPQPAAPAGPAKALRSGNPKGGA